MSGETTGSSNDKKGNLALVFLSKIQILLYNFEVNHNTFLVSY